MSDDRILYVGIAGKKHHGKDAFADFLRDHLIQSSRCVSVIRRGFADSIREEVAVFLCRELSGNPKWPANPCLRIQAIMRHLRSTEPEEKEPFRLLLQWWGLEFRRGFFGGEYWLKAMEGFAHSWREMVPKKETLVVLIPDVRMPNEVEFIREHNGLLVKVFRSGMVDNDQHATETSLDPYTGWDTLVLNDSDLDQLERLAKTFGERCLERCLERCQ